MAKRQEINLYGIGNLDKFVYLTFGKTQKLFNLFTKIAEVLDSYFPLYEHQKNKEVDRKIKDLTEFHESLGEKGRMDIF